MRLAIRENRPLPDATLNPFATMPAKSKKQQMAAGAALAAKRGEIKTADLEGASKEMYESMTGEELEALAKTRREGLPVRKA